MYPSLPCSTARRKNILFTQPKDTFLFHMSTYRQKLFKKSLACKPLVFYISAYMHHFHVHARVLMYIHCRCTALQLKSPFLCELENCPEFRCTCTVTCLPVCLPHKVSDPTKKVCSVRGLSRVLSGLYPGIIRVISGYYPGIIKVYLIAQNRHHGQKEN